MRYNQAIFVKQIGVAALKNLNLFNVLNDFPKLDS